MSVYTMKQHDTRPALEATLLDSEGNAVDLTGAMVKFIMSNGGQVVIERQVAVSDAASGVVLVAWVPGETDTAGTYRAEFEVTFSDGRVETFPNDDYETIRIMPDLG